MDSSGSRSLSYLQPLFFCEPCDVIFSLFVVPYKYTNNNKINSTLVRCCLFVYSFSMNLSNTLFNKAHRRWRCEKAAKNVLKVYTG